MRGLALVVVISLVGGSGGCGGTSSGSGGGSTGGCTAASATATTSVSLIGMAFVPSCVKGAKGAEIRWTNADTVDHTVTEDAGQPEPFDSGTLAPGQSYTHTFGQTAGTQEIHCRIHPYMTATLFVE